MFHYASGTIFVEGCNIDSFLLVSFSNRKFEFLSATWQAMPDLQSRILSNALLVSFQEAEF